MSDIDDCYRAAVGEGFDPAGTPWAEIDPDRLRTERTSLKWTRYAADVLPMFVAEMDFAVVPEIRRAITRAVERSDIGYLEGPGPLAEAFAGFASARWGWQVDHSHVHLSTDVATGLVEAFRVALPDGGRLVLTTPTYPGFFEMLQELPFEVTEVQFAGDEEDPSRARLDLAAIEREFEQGATAFILCNPHNPHGVPFASDELTQLAQLAAKHDVFVVSDEIHSPLTHHGVSFTPFAPLAAAASALSVTVTSASKGWNIAGVKCAVIVAADDRANALLAQLPTEVTTRASILGLHANVAAFADGRQWLDRAVTQIERNVDLFESLVSTHLSGVRFTRPRSGYLVWLDLREAGLGDDPVKRLLTHGGIALNHGADFGAGGAGHARINLAVAPQTIVRGVERIAAAQAAAG